VSKCHFVVFINNTLSFWLPGHKTDHFFEGNRLIVHQSAAPDAYTFFRTYLASRDSQFPIRPELWLHSDGTIPTRNWFISRLRQFFPSSIAGQSMHTGGATLLAKAGTPPNLIQTAGHWTSDTFNHYVRKNPFLFEALLIGRTSLYS